MSHKNNILSSNILYVSTEGNNTSAKRGDTQRTWRTPQDARDAAVDGELIIVFPGTYTYGNQGSGADYEGTDNGVIQLDNQEVALNYGKSDIHYYFHEGAIMQGISAGNKALFFEPYGVAVEEPSIVTVTGHLTVDTVADFIQMVYQESEWDIKFDKVLNSVRGVVVEANYEAGGGIQDIPWIKTLRLRGDYMYASGNPFAMGQVGATLASTGRTGLDRGRIEIDIPIVYGNGTFKFGFFYNYDIFIKMDHIRYSWGIINALKDTVFHFDVGLVETLNDGQGAIEEIAAMTDAEIHINIKQLRRHPDATAHYAGFAINNRFGTGGKIFLNIGTFVSDDCIKIINTATPHTQSTLHNGGYLGETQLTISGNFVELNGSAGVIALTGTTIADGVAGNVRLKLKDLTLFTGHTNCITSASAKNIIIQNVVANKISDGNVTEVGQPITVNAGYVF